MRLVRPIVPPQPAHSQRVRNIRRFDDVQESDMDKEHTDERGRALSSGEMVYG